MPLPTPEGPQIIRGRGGAILCSGGFAKGRAGPKSEK